MDVPGFIYNARNSAIRAANYCECGGHECRRCDLVNKAAELLREAAEVGKADDEVAEEVET